MAKKVKDSSFLNLINNYHIVCLYETFIIDIEIVKDVIKDAEVFFKPAVKLSQHGRPSGGVIIIIKNLIKKVFSINMINHDFDNIVCIKLKAPERQIIKKDIMT